MNLHALLKQKSYSDLTEIEQAFVLKMMSSEDYEAEHLIVVMSEKLKQNQAHLAPNPALRAYLLAKIHIPTKQIGVWSMPYRVAASVVFCFGLCYFWQKNKVAIASHETIAEIKPMPTEQITTPKPTQMIASPVFKRVVKKKNFHSKKAILHVPEQSEEEALAASLNRKNPNLAWQTDEEDADILDKPMLQCKPN